LGGFTRAFFVQKKTFEDDRMQNSDKAAFLDLASLHQELEPELLPVTQRVLRTAGFVGGPMAEEFENEFA
jgi:hypothetical protein